MPLSNVKVAAAVVPAAASAFFKHLPTMLPGRSDNGPNAELAYRLQFAVVRSFLKCAGTGTVEGLQDFTGKSGRDASPDGASVSIGQAHIDRAAAVIRERLGEAGIAAIGGPEWWTWRERDLQAEWIESAELERERRDGNSTRVVLYVHGGAYFLPASGQIKTMARALSKEMNLSFYSVDYRLAPQFPFPCALLDALAAYLSLLDKYSPECIQLVGDSAGGGLILSILTILRDLDMPQPNSAVLLSPWVDLTCSFPSVIDTLSNKSDYLPDRGFNYRASEAWPPLYDSDFAAIVDASDWTESGTDLSDPGLTPSSTGSSSATAATAATASTSSTASSKYRPAPMPALFVGGKMIESQRQVQLYCPNTLMTHPLVSPIFQPSLGGLPPVLIQTGTGEALRDENIFLARRLADPKNCPISAFHEAAQRVDADECAARYPPTTVTLQLYEKACHLAHVFSATKLARKMSREVGDFSRAQFDRLRSPASAQPQEPSFQHYSHPYNQNFVDLTVSPAPVDIFADMLHPDKVGRLTECTSFQTWLTWLANPSRKTVAHEARVRARVMRGVPGFAYNPARLGEEAGPDGRRRPVRTRTGNSFKVAFLGMKAVAAPSSSSLADDEAYISEVPSLVAESVRSEGAGVEPRKGRFWYPFINSAGEVEVPPLTAIVARMPRRAGRL